MTVHRMSLNVFGRSDVGKVREHNEDSFVVVDLNDSAAIKSMAQPIAMEVGTFGVLLAVSDGMGGAQAGEVASAMTLHALHMELPKATGGTAETALIASVEKANLRVNQAAAGPKRSGMGATLTAVLIHGGRAFVAEVGDSRAYVLRGGHLSQVTRDQTYVQALLDQGTLTRVEAERFEHKNIILQAIGIGPTVVVALSRFTLRRGDRILLCSDGLSDELTREEMQDLLLRQPNLDVACEQLVEVANSRGGRDNITVVLAELDGDGFPALTVDDRMCLETVQTFN